MKIRLLFFTLFAACLVLTTSCGSTKGYQGDKLTVTDIARIHQGTHKLRIKNKKTSEMALLVRVDSLGVGSYMKGFPKHVDVKPGERTIEIRHFQQWKDKAAMSGAMFGLIGASIAESNNPHTHYKLTFLAEQGKVYTIMPITDEVTQTPEFLITEAASSDTIRPRVVRIEKKKK